MTPLRVYLDSSVISALVDEHLPERIAARARLFGLLAKGEGLQAVVSELVVDEAMAGPEEVGRDLSDLARRVPLEVLTRSAEADELAECYIDAGVIPESSRNDALHVAMATVAEVDVILSWNFEHMVNLRRIRGVNGVNLIRGYRQIEIRAPEEVLYGRE